MTPEYFSWYFVQSRENTFSWCEMVVTTCHAQEINVMANTWWIIFEETYTFILRLWTGLKHKYGGNTPLPCQTKLVGIYLVFVKDASLYFTNSGHECRRREIVIASAATASEGAIYKILIPSLDERLVVYCLNWVGQSCANPWPAEMCMEISIFKFWPILTRFQDCLVFWKFTMSNWRYWKIFTWY